MFELPVLRTGVVFKIRTCALAQFNVNRARLQSHPVGKTRFGGSTKTGAAFSSGVPPEFRDQNRASLPLILNEVNCSRATTEVLDCSILPS